jgi:hypothetical protein
LELPAATVKGLRSAGVDWIINLLSNEQFRAAGLDETLDGLAELSPTPGDRRKSKIIVSYCFWSSDEDYFPTARQVRLTLDEIDQAHASNQIVFVNGAGYPGRAIMAAGCWLARHGTAIADRQNPRAARLGWLELARRAASPRSAAGAWNLDEAERAFICAWPSGRQGEPLRTPMELLDEEEIYPMATAEYWLRVLPTVRVYPEGRDGRCLEVPVIEENRVSNGTINIELYDLHSGTWIGERTLRLLDGTVVVFV